MRRRSVLTQSSVILFVSAFLVNPFFAHSVRAQTKPTPKMTNVLRFKVVGYAPNWNDTKAFAKTFDYGKVTHLNIAFENPTNDAGDLSYSADNDALISQAHARGVKIMVSIGGGSASGDKALIARYDALMSELKRAAFAKKLADYCVSHRLDGLDVDIEGPAIKADYGPFVHTLAQVFKPRGLLLTAALSQGYGGDKVPTATFSDFDWVNVMAYDGSGYWNPDAPGQHSSLAIAKDSAAYFIGRGLPINKTVLGVPFYGYGFGKAFRKRDYPYKDVLASFPGAEQTDQVGETIWYNGVPTIKAKTQYALDTGLAGVMIWSLDSDAQGKNSLLSAIDKTVKANAPKPRK